jgi:hypothetical protein
MGPPSAPSSGEKDSLFRKRMNNPNSLKSEKKRQRFYEF